MITQAPHSRASRDWHPLFICPSTACVHALMVAVISPISCNKRATWRYRVVYSLRNQGRVEEQLPEGLPQNKRKISSASCVTIAINAYHKSCNLQPLRGQCSAGLKAMLLLVLIAARAASGQAVQRLYCWLQNDSRLLAIPLSQSRRSRSVQSTSELRRQTRLHWDLLAHSGLQRMNNLVQTGAPPERRANCRG